MLLLSEREQVIGMFINRNQNIKPEFEIELLSSRPTLKLPMSFDETLEAMRPGMDAMAEEAPGPVRHEVAARALWLDFLSSAPPVSRIGSAVACSGGVLSTNDGNTIYYFSGTGRYTPVPIGQPIIKVANGTSEEQGRLTTPGRMNGLFGWSKDRNLIAGALSSYSHNFVAMLLGFFNRAKLPQTEPWTLPNMVLAETRVPNQFVLPASYTYSTRPAMSTKFIIETSSQTPISLGFDWWDSGKKDTARIDKVDVGAGDNRVIISVRSPMSGIFTINPLDAPKGLVVKSVNTFPRSF